MKEKEGEEKNKTGFRHQKNEAFFWNAALQSVLKNNSIHGPSLIFGADNIFMAILYILLTLLFLAYCTYQIVNTILTYLSYETVTTTEVRTEAPAQFPVVAFCNVSPFDENFAYWWIAHFLSTATSIIPSSYVTSSEYESAAEDYYKFNFLKMFLNDTSALGLGYGWQINQMLVSCRFQGKMCDQEDFMFVYDFYYSSCYRFNQGKMKNGSDQAIKYVGKPGWRHGLQLELYPGLEIQQELYVPSRGFRITVFNQSNPYQILDETGINVAPGMQTNVAIKRVFTNHLPAPYGNCLNNDITKIDWTQSDALQFMYSNFIEGNDEYYTGNFYWNWTLTYSQSLCVKLCYQKYLWETCSCYDITLPKSLAVVDLYAEEACVSITQIDCMKDAQEMFYSNNSLFQPCYTQCPIECNEVKYEYKTSMASYPTSYYADLLTNNNAFNDVINAWFAFGGYSLINYTNEYTALSRAIAKVNVFYEDMLYTVIEESPAMELEIFVCYLGGLFGMFMGGSFLSLAIVLETAYYLSLCLFRIYHARHDMKHTKQLLKVTIAREKWNKSVGDESNQTDSQNNQQDDRPLGPSISPLVSSATSSRLNTPQAEGSLDVNPMLDKLTEIKDSEVKTSQSNKDDLSSFAVFEKRQSQKKPTKAVNLEEETKTTVPQITIERMPTGRVRSAASIVELPVSKSVDDQNKERNNKPVEENKIEAKSHLDDLTSFAVFEKRVSETKPKLRLTPLESMKKRYSKVEPLWPGFNQN